MITVEYCPSSAYPVASLSPFGEGGRRKIHPISRSLLALRYSSVPRRLTRLPLGMAQKPFGKIEIGPAGDPGGFAGPLCPPSTTVIAEAGPRVQGLLSGPVPIAGALGQPLPDLAPWTIPPHADLTPKDVRDLPAPISTYEKGETPLALPVTTTIRSRTST